MRTCHGAVLHGVAANPQPPPPPAEGEQGKEKWERIIVFVRSPCQENDPADAHPSALKSVLESANPRMDSEGASGCPWSMARATPGVVKQDKSSGGSVDTTKTRSGPRRVRMSSGERPIGAAKGKQCDTEALCQPPPPPAVLWSALPLVCLCLFVPCIQTLRAGPTPPPPTSPLRSNAPLPGPATVISPWPGLLESAG